MGEVWLTAGKAGLEAVRDILKGSAAFKVGDIDDVIEVLQGALSTDFAANVSPVVNGSVKHVYSLGANEIRVGLGKSFNLVDRRAVKWLHEHHMYWSLNHYDSHVTERIKNLGEVVIKNGLSRENAGRFFQNTIGEELKRSDAYWRMTADAITTRSRSFGSIEAMVKAGATKYRVDAVIDHRTSDICRLLDGREVTVKDPETGEEKTFKLDDPSFEVHDAVTLRNQMIEAKTPEEVKEMSPWLSNSQTQRSLLSGDFKHTHDLVRSGHMFPPFHGNCRSRLVIE